MKIIIALLSLIILSNCSTHSVKLGKKCTKLASDNTYEKSLIWVVNNKNIETFDSKINKENCKINGEKL
jgi:CO dehydrogenase nickel-insertion accessory protein CooC1|tara:strand:+ start:213 stop:419 length:207 start_codon:yes stop_codon:yes gene_type:complete